MIERIAKTVVDYAGISLKVMCFAALSLFFMSWTIHNGLYRIVAVVAICVPIALLLINLYEAHVPQEQVRPDHNQLLDFMDVQLQQAELRQHIQAQRDLFNDRFLWLIADLRVELQAQIMLEQHLLNKLEKSGLDQAKDIRVADGQERVRQLMKVLEALEPLRCETTDYVETHTPVLSRRFLREILAVTKRFSAEYRLRRAVKSKEFNTPPEPHHG